MSSKSVWVFRNASKEVSQLIATFTMVRQTLTVVQVEATLQAECPVSLTHSSGQRQALVRGGNLLHSMSVTNSTKIEKAEERDRRLDALFSTYSTTALLTCANTMSSSESGKQILKISLGEKVAVEKSIKV